MYLEEWAADRQAQQEQQSGAPAEPDVDAAAPAGDLFDQIDGMGFTPG